MVGKIATLSIGVTKSGLDGSHQGLVLFDRVDWETGISPDHVARSFAQAGLVDHLPTAVLDQLHCLDAINDQPEDFATADAGNALKAQLPLIA